MNRPVLSVVIPNYNNEKYLEEMVGCICSQTFTQWELIIVDDGSTDKSYEVAKKLSNKDGRIKAMLRNREPKGGQTCRNIGLDVAKGKYIIFFDSDDLILSTCFEQRVYFMEKHDELDFAVFPAHSFKAREDFETLYRTDTKWGLRRKGDPIRMFLSNDYPFLVATNIYRKESIEEIRWDETVILRQDLIFNLTVLFKGLRFEYCDNAKFDYFYRGAWSNNNVSSNMAQPSKYEGMLHVFDLIIERIDDCSKDESAKYKQSLKHYIVHYYNELIVTGNRSLCLDFVKHFEKYYDIWFIGRLKIVSGIEKKVRSKDFRNYSSYLLFLLLFGYKFYFRLIVKALKRIV